MVERPYNDGKKRFSNVCSATQTRIQESAASRSACKLGGVRVIRQLREPLHSAARKLEVHDPANSDNPNTPRRGFRWKKTTRTKMTRNTATKTTNYHRSDAERLGTKSMFLHLTAPKEESSFFYHWWKGFHAHLLHHVANSQLGDPANAESMPGETTGG